ncbi:hypothetical protein [Solidesulfovibrio sp.]|uniref:hypothetical protein n=1 Tax=Solidesulfovibrio sp. TaxID=2910990 RepID=UPI0026268E2D|nr:hypothetical protein [Solidesulfovibrio sp.]
MPAVAGRREHPMETVERAEELWCVDGLTLADVSTRTGVATSTLKRWAEKYGWQAKRDEIRQALANIRVDTIKLRAKLITNCLGSMQAMDAFAVAKMEEVAIKAAELADKRAEAAPATAAPLREIATEADAVAALEEAVGLRLNAMLASPDKVTLSALREVKQVLDLLKDMRAAAGAATRDGAAGLEHGITAATAERIRELLGGQE